MQIIIRLNFYLTPCGDWCSLRYASIHVFRELLELRVGGLVIVGFEAKVRFCWHVGAPRYRSLVVAISLRPRH